MTSKKFRTRIAAAAILGSLAFGATACGTSSDDGAMPSQAAKPTSTASATPSASPPLSVTPAKSPSASDAAKIKQQFAAKPLSIDPASVKVPADVVKTFGEEDSKTIALSAMTFVQQLDSMHDLQVAGHVPSEKDGFTLDSTLRDLSEAGYYKNLRAKTISGKDGLVSATDARTGDSAAFTLNGKTCTPIKGQGFGFTYEAPNLALYTASSPDTAEFSIRTNVTVDCTEENTVAVRTIDRSIRFTVIDGQWKAFSHHYDAHDPYVTSK